MSRSLPLGLLLAAVALIAVAPAWASAQVPGFTPRTIDAVWTITGVERDGRTLRLAYQGGGCLRGDGRAFVEESAERIAIRVEQTQDIPGPGYACTLQLLHQRLLVTLRAPVAGRAVTGVTLAPTLFHGTAGIRFSERYVLFVIPRVIGLAPADAARVLRQQGFDATAPRPAPGDPRPAITEQLPSAGIAVGGPGGRVRVRLSSTPRHLTAPGPAEAHRALLRRAADARRHAGAHHRGRAGRPSMSSRGWRGP